MNYETDNEIGFLGAESLVLHVNFSEAQDPNNKNNTNPTTTPYNQTIYSLNCDVV